MPARPQQQAISIKQRLTHEADGLQQAMQRVAGAAAGGCRDVELRLGLLPLQQLVLLLLRFVVDQADTAPWWCVWPVTCGTMQLAYVRSMPPVAVLSQLHCMNANVISSPAKSMTPPSYRCTAGI